MVQTCGQSQPELRDMSMPAQLPIKLRTGGKTDVRTQFAALCYRYVSDELQFCLITSRGTGRWIPPKGWPMHKQTPAEAAATEAWEEAGLTGFAHDVCIGVFSYVKPFSKKQKLPVLALVYPFEVTNVHSDWPEKFERKRKWFNRETAARKVTEPELRAIILGFDPRHLRG